jgi:hypothetical protein
MMENKTAEQLADDALSMFNSLVDKFEKDLKRVPTKDEMEYIREKVMLHVFGFYERELVEPEEDKTETD